MTRPHVPHVFGLLAVLAALVLAAPIAAQATGPTWVPVTFGSPPGTPAEVFASPDSNAQETWVEVIIHGFWREDVLGGDGVTYQRIRVPGLQSIGQVGAPELPAVRVNVAVPTDAGQASLGGVDILQELTYEAIRVYPTPVPGEDEEFDPTEDPGPGDPNGTGEAFAVDAGIYGGAGPWPNAQAAEDPLTEVFYGAFEGVTCEVYPITFDPAVDELTVLAHAKYYYAHGGGNLSPIPISKQKDKLALATFVNWAAVANVGWNLQFLSYHSRYAILMDAGFDAAMHPFIQHKKTLGFDVSVIHTQVGQTLGDMLGNVRDWYLAGDPAEDHYLLLIGDTNRIPLGIYTWPDNGAQIPTDDLFASPADGDFHKEVFVGRLSIDNESDLINQTQKIITYETAPVPGGRYDRALLVAHKEGAPGKYEEAHESVRNAFYTHPPQFVTKYGSGLGPSDFQVSFEIEQGTGVVAYRGHGSTNAWTGWNAFGESYHKNDVIALGNNVHPVVWAVTCTNGNLGTSSGGSTDCVAEAWMEMAGAAGVASYAATVTTSTGVNHELDRRLFEAVYRGGLIVHGQALAYAEQHLENIWPGHKNQWAYLLLGDPSMKIRRDVPALLSITVQDSIQPGGGGADQIVFGVMSSAEPVAGALVSLYKPSLDPSQPDEVLVNAYTDEQGDATLGVSLLTPGPMSWSVQDDDGNVEIGEIEVELGSAWATLGTSVPGTHGPLSLVGVGTLQPGTYVTSILSNALENSVATLVLGFSQINAPFKGGIWVPAIDVLVPGIPTGPNGVINLPTTWPAGFPPGFSFYEQYWMADPAAVKGVASSNAIRGTTP